VTVELARCWKFVAFLIGIFMLIVAVDVVAWVAFAQSHTEFQATTLYQARLDFVTTAEAEAYAQGAYDSVKALQDIHYYNITYDGQIVASQDLFEWYGPLPPLSVLDNLTCKYEMTLSVYGINKVEVSNHGPLYLTLTIVSMLVLVLVSWGYPTEEKRQ
jgi:hypothetical protein